MYYVNICNSDLYPVLTGLYFDLTSSTVILWSAFEVNISPFLFVKSVWVIESVLGVCPASDITHANSSD